MDEGPGTKMTRRIRSMRELDVYRLAFEAAMEIFEISEGSPGKKKRIDMFAHEGGKVVLRFSQASLYQPS